MKAIDLARWLQNPAYFLRFLDILRSPGGRPLLEALAASEEKLANIFGQPPALPPPGTDATPEAQQQHEQQQRSGAGLWMQRRLTLLPCATLTAA